MLWNTAVFHQKQLLMSHTSLNDKHFQWKGKRLIRAITISMTPLLLFSHPVVSDSLWHHGLQHARLPCPSPSPRVCPSLRSLPWWWHPAISSSDALFSFGPLSFPASGTFPMSLFTSDNQSTGASASSSVLPVNIQGLFPLRLTGLISLLSSECSEVFSSTTVQYWSFSFSISPSSEYSGLISLKIDWLGLLAVQRMFRSLLQHHSSKAPTLWCSAFTIQLSQHYVTTGKTMPGLYGPLSAE